MLNKIKEVRRSLSIKTAELYDRYTDAINLAPSLEKTARKQWAKYDIICSLLGIDY